MSTRVMLTMAGLTLREAVNTRLAWAALGLAMVVVVLAQFGAAVSLAEAESTRVVLVAAALRLGYVVLLMLFIASSMSREAEDKWLEVLMSLPLLRWQILLAKLTGYGLVALLLALMGASLLGVWVAPDRVILWFVAFFGELLIVTAFTVFCMASLRNLTLSVCAALAFYLFCRIVAAVQLIAHTPITAADALHNAVQWTLDLLALVLPRLDQFAHAGWLVGEVPAVTLGPLVLQTVIYVMFLAVATLFDLHRRNY
jgi:ABC-type transport system involved in multi-copper enzyme maturation permease subunit